MASRTRKFPRSLNHDLFHALLRNVLNSLNCDRSHQVANTGIFKSNERGWPHSSDPDSLFGRMIQAWNDLCLRTQGRVDAGLGPWIFMPH
jgi:hypothetical protein